jgi:hypothetical protein
MKYEYDTHIITRTIINRIIKGLYLTSKDDEPSQPSKSYHLVLVVATRDPINLKLIYNSTKNKELFLIFSKLL